MSWGSRTEQGLVRPPDQNPSMAHGRGRWKGIRTATGFLTKVYLLLAVHGPSSSMNWSLRLVIFLTLMTAFLCSATSPSQSHTETPGRREKVCRDIHIRNRVNFSALENCTVIEGSLQILLIDYAEPSEYEHLHFPLLREITDFLLLYRVYGLRTLAHIFPNLAVIRGQRLFYNYALVAFEMPELEELGLTGLMHIVRGSVRLEKNAKLCYVDTINWARIARNVSREDHFISHNKDTNGCADVCPADCPRENLQLFDGTRRRRQLCWTANHCQKICPLRCDSGCYLSRQTQQMECCNEQCIGGCEGPSALECFACKHVVGIDGRCQPRCSGTYKYLNRRCILAKDCKSIRSQGTKFHVNVQWKMHKNECIRECPSGYMEDGFYCKKCEGLCPKECRAVVVDSVAAAQELKGCTVVEGDLEIQIRGGSQMGRELLANLGLIEEVTEYVKIVRSFAIVSLHFLQNLKVILGKRQFNDRYSLFVLDNPNLEEIWDLKGRAKLAIRGALFFHRNHKLCHYKIVEFAEWIGVDITHQDISPISNGNQIPCNVSQIDLRVSDVRTTIAIVNWSPFQLNDDRKLLGYVLYYKESPYKNQTIFNTKDSCDSMDWQTKDVRPVQHMTIAEIVYNLKPWTQYALYIQTYTLSPTDEGGVSPIIYFTTLPTTPTHPRDVVVEALSPRQLKVTWLPPAEPNGNVTHYQVYWQPQPLNREKLDQRNYCRDKLHLMPKNRVNTVEKEKEEERNQTIQPGSCCKCPKTEEERKQEEEERRMGIEFQNFLQDTVYIKRAPKKQRPSTESPSSGSSLEPASGGQPAAGSQGDSAHSSRSSAGRLARRRRALNDSNMKKMMQNMGLNTSYWPEGINISSLSNMSMANDTSISDDDHVPFLAAVVIAKTEIILPKLRHFQEYSIEVIACHDPQGNASGAKQCSNRAITTGRTLPLPSADTINQQNISATPESEGRVRIKWLDPPEPNGLIVSYEIEYGKVSQENYKLDVLCIPHKEYRKRGGYILGNGKRLPPGNYSYRLRATGLAGNGTWTPYLHFYIAERYEESPFKNMLVIIIPLFVLIVGCAIIFFAYLMYRKRTASLPSGVLYASVNPHYMSPNEVYVPDDWEVPRDKIKLIRELGQGSFGMVHEGIARDLKEGQPRLRVAVKTVNENATFRDRIEFLKEASVMKAFSCHHVVKLLGVVSKGQPTMVIMELMACGDLKKFLWMHRPDEDGNCQRKPPTLRQILQMAAEIADGMGYLAAKKFVHRDLAARNCMVNEDCIVKIGDFGMTRDIYETDYYRKGGQGLLPVRWMAPESLKDGIYTSLSDVWSYGVVLWEMATLAAQPYQGLSNKEVLRYVIDNGVMQQPQGCPDRLYNLMLLCWQHNSKNRPAFMTIIETLESELNESFVKNSYYHSEERRQREREMAAMAAAQANAIGPEDFVPCNEDDDVDDENDITTPLTGSPRYGSRQLDEAEVAEDEDDPDEEPDSQCRQSPRPCSPGLPAAPTDAAAAAAINDTGDDDRQNSSSSNFVHLNGLTNGHLPRPHLPQQRFAEC